MRETSRLKKMLYGGMIIGGTLFYTITDRLESQERISSQYMLKFCALELTAAGAYLMGKSRREIIYYTEQKR